MSKRLGVSPKSVESRVSVQSEAHQMLWEAVPRRRGENLKAWFPRAARELGWTARRVRSFWNMEARRVDYAEIATLNQRIEALKAAEARHQREANEIRTSLEMGRDGLPVDGRATQRGGNEVAPAGSMVPRQGGE